MILHVIPMVEKKADDIYKDSRLQGDQPACLLANFSKGELEREVEEAKKALKDPFLLSSIMLRTVRERESTNMILKQIMEKLESLERKIGEFESSSTAKTQVPPIDILPQTDEEIIAFISEKNAACARDVQKKFHYKGKNAACARLSRLSDMGYLLKKQVGRQVFYTINKAHFGGKGSWQ